MGECRNGPLVSLRGRVFGGFKQLTLNQQHFISTFAATREYDTYCKIRPEGQSPERVTPGMPDPDSGVRRSEEESAQRHREHRLSPDIIGWLL